MSFYLLWVPLKVPHRVGGSADAGLSTENSSEQVPVELGWSKTAVSKSNLIWQISEKKNQIYVTYNFTVTYRVSGWLWNWY